MKNFFRVFSLTIAICLFMLFTSCGGDSNSVNTNEYLGDLPSIAKNYLDKIDAKEIEIKEITDKNKYTELSKEYKLLKKESDAKVEEYLSNNPITTLPFAVESDYPFTVNELSILKCSDTRIEFKAKVTMTKDVPKRMFVYIKAIDKEGNKLTKKNGVMGDISFSKKSFKATEEVELSGSLDGPADLINFDKLLLISKEEYNK